MSNHIPYVFYVKCGKRELHPSIKFMLFFYNSCIKLLSMITFLFSENLMVLF